MLRVYVCACVCVCVPAAEYTVCPMELSWAAVAPSVNQSLFSSRSVTTTVYPPPVCASPADITMNIHARTRSLDPRSKSLKNIKGSPRFYWRDGTRMWRGGIAEEDSSEIQKGKKGDARRREETLTLCPETEICWWREEDLRGNEKKRWGGEDVKGKLTGDGALGRLKQTEEGRGRKRKKKRGLAALNA